MVQKKTGNIIRINIVAEIPVTEADDVDQLKDLVKEHVRAYQEMGTAQASMVGKVTFEIEEDIDG